MANKETLKNDIATNTSFLTSFNIVKPQIGWKRVNKKRKIRLGLIRNFKNLRVDKELKLFAGANKKIVPIFFM
jgi:hypothetical protein